MWAKQKKSGFTIVELLIVIVVIGILATITIVAYNGIQNRSRISSVSQSLSQASKKIKVWQVDNPNSSPADLATVGIADTDDVTYQYTAGSNGGYCITATNGNVSYKITESTNPTSGGCAGHGQGGVAAVTNIAVNPSVETNITGIGIATAGSTVTRETNGSATNGAYVVKVVTAGSGANEGALVSTAVPSFGTYTGSVYVWGSGTVRTWLRFGYTDTTYTEGTFSGTYTLSSTPQRISSSTTFTDNGKTPSYLFLFIRTSSTQASTFYLDSFMVNAGSLVGYADGNTVNWIWNGTANNSTSTGPAL